MPVIGVASTTLEEIDLVVEYGFAQ